MPASFQVYVDESGDDGFTFRPDGSGSSAWMVLSAVMVRTCNEALFNQKVMAAKTKIGKAPNEALHFVEIKNHDKRRAVAAEIPKMPCKIVSIMAYKKGAGPNPFIGQRHLFYRYISRLLLERVSWICRDYRRANDGGDGAARIIFSNKANLPYSLYKEYLEKLHSLPEDNHVQIDPQYINSNCVTSLPHHQRAGLQAADIAASSCYEAVRLNPFGMADTSYIKLIAPAFYRHKGKTLLSYGLKWWPHDFEKLKAANPHIAELAAL